MKLQGGGVWEKMGQWEEYNQNILYGNLKNMLKYVDSSSSLLPRI